VFATPTSGTQAVSVQYRSPATASMRETKCGWWERLVLLMCFPPPHRPGATRSVR
jgi:hypothetical protein